MSFCISANFQDIAGVHFLFYGILASPNYIILKGYIFSAGNLLKSCAGSKDKQKIGATKDFGSFLYFCVMKLTGNLAKLKLPNHN